MLRFTKQMDYGLIAIQYISEHQGDGAVGVKRIADEFRIPSELLAKVLQRLTKRGLMASQSGRHGGYRLTVALSDVTVGQVVDALKGPVAIVGCMADQDDDCPPTTRGALSEPARRIEAAIAGMLGTMTVAELIRDGVHPRAEDGSNGVVDHEGLALTTGSCR